MPLNNTVKIIRAPVEVRRHGFTLPLLLTRVETLDCHRRLVLLVAICRGQGPERGRWLGTCSSMCSCTGGCVGCVGCRKDPMWLLALDLP